MTATKRRLLVAASVVLVVVGCRDAPDPVTRRPGLSADVGGSIELAVCSVNSARRSALRNAALVTNIVNTLPPRVEILLLVNDRAAFQVAKNPWPKRVRFVQLPAQTRITIWPQDPFVVLARADGSREILGSRVFGRAGDRGMGDAIAAELGWPCRTAKLSFEGGNIVSDRDAVFIGAATIRENMVELGWDEPTVAGEFAHEFGRKVVVIGSVPQPVGHIDMILTPLGGSRLALADPGWGAKLAERALGDDPQSVADFEQRCERMFLGDPDIEELRDKQGNVIQTPPIVGRTPRAVAASRTLAVPLDQLAAELEAAGYRVVRMPFLHPPLPASGSLHEKLAAAAAGDRTGGQIGDELSIPGPDYPYLSYNNVLLETFAGRDVVYLPQYGWPAMDRAAKLAWEELGFVVKVVPGFATSAMYGGALRCCVKVLARDQGS